MQDDPKNPMQHDDRAEEAENREVEHLDHRHDPDKNTPDNLQHGNRYRPEGE